MKKVLLSALAAAALMTLYTAPSFADPDPCEQPSHHYYHHHHR